jgi:HAD superfamily hydrolase (TIGR01509 family)
LISQPKVIFFDVGNTLLYPSWKKILVPLGSGSQVNPELLLAAERSAKRQLDLLTSTTGKVDHDYWQHFFEFVLEGLSMNDPGVRAELIRLVRLSANWGRIAPDAIAVLEELGKRYRLGVISNADGDVANQLQNCGLTGYFECIIDSGEFGIEKPDARIFEHAAEVMKLSPMDCLYVGDVFSIDYEGAMAAGMQAILCYSSKTYADTKSDRIDSLSELLTLPILIG